MMINWRLGFAVGLVWVFFLDAAGAELGVYSLGGKVGLDVVQGRDARRFYGLQSDVATVFSPRLLMEVSGEVGFSNDFDEELGASPRRVTESVRVIGGGVFFKYFWPGRTGTDFAYMGGGGGMTRIRRDVTGRVTNSTEAVLHFILIGLEKHVVDRRLKGILEVRWVIGEVEDSSSLRVGAGVGVVLKRP